MKPKKNELYLSIRSAKYLRDYVLLFKFNDGKAKEVDFHGFLSGSSHPQIRKYLDLKLFKKFSIKHGEILWNDYELCFPVADLYAGQLNKSNSLRRSA